MIREYRPDDLDTIVDIGNRAWREIYEMFRGCYGDELFGLLVPDERTAKGNQVKAHCERHPEWVHVCEEAGRVVGFVTFRLHADTKIGVISNNAVDPACDLKGIGQQMYKAVLDHFRAHGMAYAKVQTGLDDAHARARRAYERAGFDICHRDIEYYMKLQAP
jgi:ribosomal protein S18 acetylase RimI-like enzyme